MERVRRHRAEPVQPPMPLPERPSAPLAAEAAGAEPTVQVIWGPITEHMAVGGMTVEEVRTLLQRPYNIPAHAAVVVNGQEVRARHQLAAGDVLEFVRLAGEKGG